MNGRSTRKSLWLELGALLTLLAVAILWAPTPHSLAQQDNRQLKRDQTQPNGAVQRRIALVIGNGNYQRVSPLDNPVNDATDIAAALQGLGFEVIKDTDTNLVQMRRLIREFGERLAQQKGIGLFYFAGHGVEVRGRNFLVPVDADIAREAETEDYAVDVNAVLRQMDAADNGFNIVILDACRNNPFSRGWNRSGETGGLANVNAPTGTYIAFAAAPGSTASDGKGMRNGIFTGALLKNLKRPNLKLEEVFKATREEVMTLTDSKQVPWDSSSVKGDFYFSISVELQTQPNSTAVIPKPTPLPTPTPVSVAQNFDAEGIYWNEISRRDTRSGYELYIAEYPAGKHIGEAGNKIDKFKQNELAHLKDLERTKWREVQSLGSKDAYQSYLSAYPNGEFAVDARLSIKTLESREEQAKWDEVQILNRKTAFQSYLSAYPYGKYAAAAKQKIGEFEAAEAISQREKEKATEQAKWNEAERLKTVAGYKGYLSIYSNGEFARLARLRLRDLGEVVTIDASRTSANPISGSIIAGTLISNSLKMKFAYIPAGSFQMGGTQNDSEKPIHTVSISHGFYMGTTEVTQAQWVSVMWNNPSSFNNCDNCPVENVSWEDVQAFIKKLNARGDGKYRLPTEAEWEYAARAASTTKYSFGDGEGSLGSYAWYDANSGSTTHEVATKKPNAWGLYDMHGNVWEWMQDWYGDYSNGSATDPAGAVSGSDRVLRSGSWGVGAVSLRSACRNAYSPLIRDQFLGFRLVRY